MDRALGDETPLPRDVGDRVRGALAGTRARNGSGRATAQRRLMAEFRAHLATAIATRPEAADESAATAYYACWLDALEALLAQRGLLDPLP